MLGTEFGLQFPFREQDEVVEFPQSGGIAQFREGGDAQGLKLSHVGGEARFLAQLPQHRRPRGFPRLQVSTEKVPETGFTDELTTLAEEELPGSVTIDEGPGTGVGIHGLYLTGGLRIGPDGRSLQEGLGDKRGGRLTLSSSRQFATA